MGKPKFFKTKTAGDLPLPVFFPDATRAVIKVLDSEDIKATKTPGILVNTYHLYKDLGKKVIKEHGTVREFMNWYGGVISDSGGFQIMSLLKTQNLKSKTLSKTINDKGVKFKIPGQAEISLTPEESIEFQIVLGSDMVVVLDDFTPPNATYEEAKETVDRTILWAKRCKEKFEELTSPTSPPASRGKPYLLGVVQGGSYQDLRKHCIEELIKIGFDGLGYGGWPLRPAQGKPFPAQGKPGFEFDYESAKTIANNSPENYFLYGLGIGKPQEIVALTDMGFNIFDCVLPTRDARHKRLYVYNADSVGKINVRKPNFYSYFTPDKERYYKDTSPVSLACDCLLCSKYTRSYLAHLFRNDEPTAGRLATIHNLRFYSLLMEKLRI